MVFSVRVKQSVNWYEGRIFNPDAPAFAILFRHISVSTGA
jgi:hypothetical protein